LARLIIYSLGCLLVLFAFMGDKFNQVLRKGAKDGQKGRSKASHDGGRPPSQRPSHYYKGSSPTKACQWQAVSQVPSYCIPLLCVLFMA